MTAVNGESIGRSGDLSSRISLATPGETVRIAVWRDRAARELVVKLGRAEEGTRALDQKEREPPGQLGLVLRALTRDEQAQANLQGGLLVEGVGGAAARAGILIGDVLLAINGVPLKSMDQIRNLMDKKPKNVALLVLRNGERLFVPVELD